MREWFGALAAWKVWQACKCDWECSALTYHSNDTSKLILLFLNDGALLTTALSRKTKSCCDSIYVAKIDKKFTRYKATYITISLHLSLLRRLLSLKMRLFLAIEVANYVPVIRSFRISLKITVAHKSSRWSVLISRIYSLYARKLARCAPPDVRDREVPSCRSIGA